MVSTLAAVLGFIAPVQWTSAARHVDAHYKLQDRTITALAFAEVPSADALKQLQLADALERLQKVVAKDAVPYRVPKSATMLVVPLALLIGLACLPRAQAVVDPGQGLLQQVVNDQAQALQETMLEDLQELAKKHPEPELKELTEELAELVDELKAPESRSARSAGQAIRDAASTGGGDGEPRSPKDRCATARVRHCARSIRRDESHLRIAEGG